MRYPNRIAELRGQRGWTLDQLAAAVERSAGVATSRQQMHKLEQGTQRLNQDWLDRLSAAFDVDPADLLPAVAGGGAPKRPVVREAAIVELDVRAAGGDGGVPDTLDAMGASERAVAEWRLPSVMLRAQTTAHPDRMRIITVYGDSMVPDFAPGDRILIDTEDRIPSPPGVFAIWDGFGLVVKRVEIVMNSTPARVTLISRNKEYATREHPLADVQFRGRVIGKWQWS